MNLLCFGLDKEYQNSSIICKILESQVLLLNKPSHKLRKGFFEMVYPSFCTSYETSLWEKKNVAI